MWANTVLKWQVNFKDALFRHLETIWEEMRDSPGIYKNLKLPRKSKLNFIIDNHGGHTKYK